VPDGIPVARREAPIQNVGAYGQEVSDTIGGARFIGSAATW
jgi:UDP-N-acetylenolpyruvoylglucosamine reductase